MTQPMTWITGASTGIGRALAIALAQRGHKVIASARSADKLAELARVEQNIIAYPLDVTDSAAVAQAVATIEEQHGPLETIILNAGGWEKKNIGLLKTSDVQAIFDLNVMGQVRVLEHVLPRLQQRGRGHIALVASVAGYRGLPGAMAYCASKAACINMAETLRIDLADSGIKVQVINPGFVKTPLTDVNKFPMPFIISPEKAADYIMRGMAGNGFEITFPKRFTYMLKFLSLLPYALYFPLMGVVARGEEKK